MEYITIKCIALATGELYENVLFQGNREKFISSTMEREFISITQAKTEILINPDFIVSIVI